MRHLLDSIAPLCMRAAGVGGTPLDLDPELAYTLTPGLERAVQQGGFKHQNQRRFFCQIFDQGLRRQAAYFLIRSAKESHRAI